MNPEIERDMVNHPEHYISKQGIETIEVIEAFTEDLVGIEAVDTANVIKYICRWKNKNGIEDLKKARWYLNHLICMVEEAEVAEEVQARFEENTDYEFLDGQSYLLYTVGDSHVKIAGDRGIRVIRDSRESNDKDLQLYLRKG